MKKHRTLSGAPLRRLYGRLRAARRRVYPEQNLHRSAMVFSPHFDDETLGCGGMIIKKRRAGATLKLVFMTDGSRSHQHLMDPAELAAIRYAEAIEAGRIMGVAETDIMALGFQEGELGDRAEAAVDRVAALLQQYCPAEIWVPHSAEPLIWSADHHQTTRIVKDAAHRCGGHYTIYEYPVWLWFSYPWIDLPMTRRRETLRLLKTSITSVVGLRLTRSCVNDLNIEDVLDVKREALAAYRSQTTRLRSDTAWPTLADVANGQFLQCFFQPLEVYATGRLDE